MKCGNVNPAMAEKLTIHCYSGVSHGALRTPGGFVLSGFSSFRMPRMDMFYPRPLSPWRGREVDDG